MDWGESDSATYCIGQRADSVFVTWLECVQYNNKSAIIWLRYISNHWKNSFFLEKLKAEAK